MVVELICYRLKTFSVTWRLYPISHRGVIASRIISLEKFCMVANHSIKATKLFHLKKLAMWYLICI